MTGIGIGLGLIPTAARPSATTAPVNVVKPFFAGILTQGQSAEVNPGSWTGLPAANFTYAIKRGATTVSTNPAYVWTSADVVAGPGAMTVDVTATNEIGPTTATSDPATIVAPLALAGSPPAATVGAPYSFTPTRTGGHAPFVFALSGTLPTGLSFSTSTGAITGTPVASGTASLSIGVIDDDDLIAGLGPFNLLVTSTPEIPTPTGMSFMGDSRTGFALGVGVNGTVWSSTHAHGQSVAGWFQHTALNKILRTLGGQYAFPSSTTLRQANALASASVATTGNSAQALTSAANNADAAFNPYSSGDWSVLDNPANVVVYLPAVENDRGSAYYTGFSPAPLRSMLLIADMLDDLEAADKIVLLGNEMPNGYRPVFAEAKTLTGSTSTPTNTTGFVDGESFGVVGVIDGDTNLPMPKVVGAPGVGQYSITGTTYTWNATRPSKVFKTYCYGPEATVAYKVIAHEWLQSSASNFVGSNGTDYGVPGALFGRTKVFSLDTWGALLDPTSGANNYAKKGALSDTVHPGQYGGLLAGKAFASKVQDLWPGLASQALRPTKNNWKATIASGTLGTVPQKLTFHPVPGVMGALPLTPGAQRVRLVSNLGTWVGNDMGDGTIAGEGFSTVPGDCTINYATGIITVKVTAPANTTAASVFVVEQDPANILANGLFDPGQGNGTAKPAGITGAELPAGWAFVNLNAELVTALSLGKAAGGIDIALAQVTAPDGTPGIQFSIDGNPGAGSPALTIQPATSLYMPQLRLNAATPDLFRSAINTRLEAGANGHLYGIFGASLTNTLTSSTNITRTYNATSLNAVSGTTAGGTAAVPYSDLVLADGPLDMELVLDELSTAGMTPAALTWRATVSLSPSVPNSGKVTLWAASLRTRN